MSGLQEYWPWLLLGVYGVTLVALAPTSRDAAGFYAGRDARGKEPSLYYLFGSIFIAWIFAKSVTNAADLGATFGLPGAIAYASYWLSIPVAGLVIVRIRRTTGATSLAEWLTSRFGRAAALTFLLAVMIRLYNEVWSNTAVVGAYFGERGSTTYYAGALVFTGLTLLYTMKGGLRSSIWTDAIHAGVFAVFLTLVVLLVLPRAGGGGDVGQLVSAGSWTMAGGVDLLLVGLLQSLSYPFHDPILTDRGFLANERTTLRAYFLAGGAGAIAIVLFGLVGVTAFVSGTPVQDDAPRAVAASLGVGALVLVNVVMLTSAGSTVDSTFSSVAKAVNVDLPGKPHAVLGVTAGRWAMLAAAVLGNIPLFFGTAILKATTISGTMVMGLAPAFLLGLLVRDAPPLSFHLAFWGGIALGVADVMGIVPPAMAIGGGSYATLLGVNAWGLVVTSLLFAAPLLLRRTARVEEGVGSPAGMP